MGCNFREAQRRIPRSVFLTIQASKNGAVLRMKSRNAMLHAESALKSLTSDQLEKASLPSPCSLSNLVQS